MAYYSVHAGHGKQDSKSCGASTNLLKESVANREVKNELIKILKEQREVKSVFDDTVDYPSNQSDCINKIVANINSHKNLDLAVSIHFNSGRNDLVGDNSIGGFEVIVNNNSGAKIEIARRMCAKMKSLGFRDRGVKINTALGVLKCKPQALLVEVCFVDDKDDVKLYEKLGSKAVAKALAESILNKEIGTPTVAPTAPTAPTAKTYYRIVTSSFSDKANAEKELDRVKKAGFKDAFITTYTK